MLCGIESQVWKFAKIKPALWWSTGRYCTAPHGRFDGQRKRMTLMQYACTEGQDEHPHPRSLIRTFSVRRLIPQYALVLWAGKTLPPCSDCADAYTDRRLRCTHIAYFVSLRIRKVLLLHSYISSCFSWPDKAQIRKVITKTRLFKYIENVTTKKPKVSREKFWYFSYFCSKHRLWVLIRTASPRRF